MVLRCDVKGCHRNSIRDKCHSFFRLPTDVETRKKWLQFLGRNKNHSSHLRICIEHFDENAIRKRYPRPLLARNTVPKILVPVVEKTDDPTSTLEIQSRDDDEQTYTGEEKMEKLEERLPLVTQIINIHVNDVCSIIISGKKRKIIINLIRDHENERGDVPEKQ